MKWKLFMSLFLQLWYYLFSPPVRFIQVDAEFGQADSNDTVVINAWLKF